MFDISENPCPDSGNWERQRSHVSTVVADEISTCVSEAMTKLKIDLFCLQMQISNIESKYNLSVNVDKKPPVPTSPTPNCSRSSIFADLPMNGSLSVKKELANTGEQLAEASRSGRVVATARRKGVRSGGASFQARKSRIAQLLASYVESRHFESIFCVIIFLNFASMGAEAHYYVLGNLSSSGSIFLQVLENVFTFTFVSEMTLRLVAYGPGFYVYDVWNMIDLLIVGISIVAAWIVPLIELVSQNAIDRAVIRILTILRTARLFRLVGMLRRVEFLKEVWSLMRGIVGSMRILTWTVVLIFFLAYSFAIFGLFLIAKPIQDSYEQQMRDTGTDTIGETRDWTCGIDKFMYLLINLMVGDYRSDILTAIQAIVPASWVFFYIYIAIGTLVLLNLVTAIIVDNAIQMSRDDEEEKKKLHDASRRKDLDEMKVLFEMMDENGDGTLNLLEFQQSFEDPEMAYRWQRMDFSREDADFLFKFLDNGDGEVDTDEFFDGLPKLRGLAKSKDVFQVTKLLQRLCMKLEALDHNSSKSRFMPNGKNGSNYAMDTLVV